MEHLVGETLDMEAAMSNEDDVNISTLDTVGSPTGNTHIDDNDDTTAELRDYAAGYTVIISKMMGIVTTLDRSTGDIQDIKNMLIDTAHSVSNLVQTVEVLSKEVSHLKSKLQEVYEKQDTVIASTSNFDTEAGGTDVELQNASGIHTRQVSSTVPACIIRSCWYKSTNKSDMGVTMKYLKALCNCVFPSLGPQVKSELGIMLSRHIDAHENNSLAGDNMMMVLCGDNNVTLSEGRMAIIRCMKLLGTKYSFMLPSELSTMLAKVDSMREGVVVFGRLSDPNDIMFAGQGYDLVSLKLIDQPKVRKGLKRLHLSNPNKTAIRTFLKSIKEGTLDNDGKARAPLNTGSKSTAPLFGNQVSSETDHISTSSSNTGFHRVSRFSKLKNSK